MLYDDCAQHCMGQKVQEDSWGNAPSSVLLSPHVLEFKCLPVPLAEKPLYSISAFPSPAGSDAGLTVVLWGGNKPFTSTTWDQLDPAWKPLPKFLCSPRDGVSPVAVYSPLICSFSGRAQLRFVGALLAHFLPPSPHKPLCLMKQCMGKDCPPPASVWVPRTPRHIPKLCNHLCLLPNQCFHISVPAEHWG